MAEEPNLEVTELNEDTIHLVAGGAGMGMDPWGDSGVSIDPNG